MDLKGQLLALFLYRVINVGALILAMIIGYAAKDFVLALWVMVAGGLVSLAVVVPDWPFYNRHPLRFK